MPQLKALALAAATSLLLAAHSPVYSIDSMSDAELNAYAEGVAKSIEAQDQRTREAKQKFEQSLEAALKGNRESQYDVGITYGSPLQVVDQDDAVAFQWLLKSAQQGYLPAQEQVARYYRRGRGMPKDFGQALHWYQRAADQGSQVAALALGELYKGGDENGNGKNFAQALHWYTKAADQESKDAIMALGRLYRDGDEDGNGRDLEKATGLFLKMTTSGADTYVLGASNALLELYETHYPHDSENILYWMEQAYAAGWGHLRSRLIAAYTDGQLAPPNDGKLFQLLSKYGRRTQDEDYRLAIMYEEGRGVKKSRKKAEEIFSELVASKYPQAVIRQALRDNLSKAQKGNAQAQYEIAVAYLEKRELSDREIEDVFNWLEKASQKKHREAEIALASFHGDPRSGERRNVDKAFAMIEEIAQRGDAEVQFEMYRIYKDVDSVKALYWLQTAANQGESFAQFYLGEAYFKGELGLARNMDEAVEWYYASANQGVVEAIYEMGHMYDHGHGVEQDLEIAVEWYEAAAEYGSSFAKQRLAQLKGSK